MEATKKQREIIDEIISCLNQFKYVSPLTDVTRQSELYSYKIRLLKLKEEDNTYISEAINNIYRIILTNKE